MHTGLSTGLSVRCNLYEVRTEVGTVAIQSTPKNRSDPSARATKSPPNVGEGPMHARVHASTTATTLPSASISAALPPCAAGSPCPPCSGLCPSPLNSHPASLIAHRPDRTHHMARGTWGTPARLSEARAVRGVPASVLRYSWPFRTPVLLPRRQPYSCTPSLVYSRCNYQFIQVSGPVRVM